MAIPAGIVIAWDSSATIPTGWSRATDLDSKFPKTTTGDGTGTGGSATHVHDSTGHTHTGGAHSHSSATSGNATGDTSETSSSTTRSDALITAHTHSASSANNSPTLGSTDHGDWSSASNNPAHYTVRWIVSDGSPSGFPNTSIVYFKGDSIPSGWSLVQGNKFLMGATGGANGGASDGGSHTHTTGAHTHSFPSHAHSGATSSIHNSGGGIRHGSCIGGHPNSKWVVSNVSNTHTHTMSAWGSSGGMTSSSVDCTSGSTTYEPEWIKVTTIQNGSGGESAEEGMVVGWLGAASAVPDEWVICNGSNDTPTYNAKFIKGAASNGEADSTGGSAGHQNSSGTHTHASSHSHGTTGAMGSTSISTAGYETGSGGASHIGGFDVYMSSASHSHAAGGTSSTTTSTSAGTSPQLDNTADTQPAFRNMLMLQYQPVAGGDAIGFGANF